MLGLGLALVLFVLAGLLLVIGVVSLMFAPILASRVAATTTRPKLERRASGDDRMRALINAQISERRKRSGLSQSLSRTGIVLAGTAVVLLVAGLVAHFAGY
jgi:Na+-transporting methylmalonyl-CoA/oxaloacetate decarboxylase gamma subunit